MTVELAGAIIYFVLTVFALLFTITKSSHVESDSFPNRGRFYAGLVVWVVTAILAVFMSFPGYSDWFVPTAYPILKVSVILLFLAGFFMVMTTLVAFPIHMDYFRQEIHGRSDRIALLENIRQIVTQPYPITELFTLVLKELGSYLVVKKGAIFLIDPSRREMYLVAQIGLEKSELERLEHFPVGQDIISRAAFEQSPFVSGDLAAADTASRKLFLGGRDITMSAAAIPMSSRDRSMGTLLVLSEKLYRFEKRDRMLLNAAAEALAAVIETNRLARENQKLAGQVEETTGRLNHLRDGVSRLATVEKSQQVLTPICRYLVESYRLFSCCVFKIDRGELIDVARFETSPEAAGRSESYRIAVIDAVRRKKMVVLNQEARRQDGSTYINRTALLCPVALQAPGDYALLLEGPGNGLPLTDRFLAEIESLISLTAATLNFLTARQSETLSQSAVRSLLNILKIDYGQPHQQIFRQFLQESERLLAGDSMALFFVHEVSANGYRMLSGLEVETEGLEETVFAPGEGPIGRVAASGDVLEYFGRDKVEQAWSDLEAVNQDFLNRLFIEKGTPGYQLNVPIRILDEVVGVLAVFSHETASPAIAGQKSLILLAGQLLAIKLSMTRLDDRRFRALGGDVLSGAGDILNRINNDLATIVGRAQLLERQPDVAGQAKYTAGEILKAAELAADAVKRLQKEAEASQALPPSGEDDFVGRLDRYLAGRHVTGNLYMFDNNMPVMLQRELLTPSPFSPADTEFAPVIEAVLKKFVSLLEEGDELLLRSELRQGYFYLSLVRGSRETHGAFDPTRRDFGDPDVLPTEFTDENQLKVLANNRGAVSFDRFGRRPTYLSFRFPCPEHSAAPAAAKVGDRLAGLRILAIDDQQMILDLLAGICQSLGFELTTRRNPDEGMELFIRQPFDIVMVDLAIGRVSGWDIAREVKRRSPETPVIMMTGWGIDISPDEAVRGGVDYTLAKPFKIEQLTDVINRAKARHISS